MTTPRRAAIYARVSTLDQEPENQLVELRRYVAARGWTAVEFVDRGVSGTKDRRPALDRLVRDAKQRRFDALPEIQIPPTVSTDATQARYSGPGVWRRGRSRWSPQLVAPRKMTRRGINTRSLIRNLRPTAERTASAGAYPRQHSAAKMLPIGPHLSACITYTRLPHTCHSRLSYRCSHRPRFFECLPNVIEGVLGSFPGHVRKTLPMHLKAEVVTACLAWLDTISKQSEEFLRESARVQHQVPVRPRCGWQLMHPERGLGRCLIIPGHTRRVEKIEVPC